jgi:tryptophan 2,3-dioxygenase
MAKPENDKKEPLYYGDYLQIGKLLDAQHLESSKIGPTAHDEMLFIIVHQAFELWFKQILWELDALKKIFLESGVQEKALGKGVAHLERIVQIQRLFSTHIDILETMTPLDFLDFRDALFPASGFQSAQWRLVENSFGLRPQDRFRFGKTKYSARLNDSDRDRVEEVEQASSIFDLVEQWLERTPFIRLGDFDFWTAYEQAVKAMLDRDRSVIEKNPLLSDQEKVEQYATHDKTKTHFAALFDETAYAKLVKDGSHRLSHRALQASLLIHLYRDEPILHTPFRFLKTLVDIDENFSAWRYRHALMAARMIGTKIGTGGSSGHEYLRRAAEHNKVFSDLTNLSTFFIPRSVLPELPEHISRQMGFRFSPEDTE